MPLKSLWTTGAHLLRFLPYYLREMTLSNLRIARDVFRSNPKFEPGFIRLDLNGYGPFQRWAAASLISMTPGTLSVDLSDKFNVLCVHALYLKDPERMRADLYHLLSKALGERRKERTI
jgi:multicomponent Na+:H+ antiporter subunit E